MKSKKRIVLSIALLFQLLVVGLSPNLDSYFGQIIAPWIEPYASSLEMAANWNFFAPDPGPPPLFIEWEAFDTEGKVVASGAYPEKRDPFFLRERQTRRIGFARFLYFASDRLIPLWGDYACRTNPGAHGVRIWRVMQSVPNLFDVQKGARRIDDDLGIERSSAGTHFCNSTVLEKPTWGAGEAPVSEVHGG